MADAIMEERTLNEMTPIHPLPACPYKQEEIDWLCALADQIPEGSRLASLITPNLINWFAYQVKKDGSPDLLGAWEYERLISRGKTGATAQLAADHEKQAGQLQERIDQADSHAVQLSELADAWQKRADKLGQLNDWLGAEILDLKAKLYDYLIADLAWPQ